MRDRAGRWWLAGYVAVAGIAISESALWLGRSHGMYCWLD